MPEHRGHHGDHLLQAGHRRLADYIFGSRTLSITWITPFVAFTSMLFPVSNVMVVSALPARASWGVGIYRATLMLASAACAGLMSVALRWFDTRTVMLAGLAIPLLGIVSVVQMRVAPTLDAQPTAARG